MAFFLRGQFQGFNKYAPFSKLLLIHIENVCVSNSFLSFQVTPMKLAALWSLWRVDVHTKLDKLTSYKSKTFCFLFLFFTWCLHELWQL